jgi:hypothetical protein
MESPWKARTDRVAREAQRNDVVINVRDNGPGIDAAIAADDNGSLTPQRAGRGGESGSVTRALASSSSMVPTSA